MGNDREVSPLAYSGSEPSDWYKDAIVYQIYIRSFQDSNNDGIGDIQGIISRLEYLSQLGIQVLWLSPFNTSPNDDNGYDVSDYYAINPEYGSLEDFGELVHQCRKRKIKIMMDLVLNHSSDQHPWFLESRSSTTNPKRDWYIWRSGKPTLTSHPHDLLPPNNWDSYFGGSAWEYDGTTQEFYLHIFSTKQPDLNWANSQVRQEFVNICQFWIEQGVDAFRLDAVHHIGKPVGLPDAPEHPDNPWHYRLFKNTKETHRYLRELNLRVFAPHNIFTVGETGGTNPGSARKYVDHGRKELDVIFHFDRFYFGEQTLAQGFARDLDHWYQALSKQGWDAQFLSNHDLSRQVSNFGDDRYFRGKSAKALAVLNLTTWGTPFLYQGEEIGFPNPHYSHTKDFRDRHARRNLQDALSKNQDKDFAYGWYHLKNRDNSRSPMAWNSTTNGGFTSEHGEPWMPLAIHSSWINVDLEETWSPDVLPIYGPGGYQSACGILTWYKELIALRRSEPALSRGSFSLLYKTHPWILGYQRVMDSRTSWMILINLSAHVAKIDFHNTITPFKLQDWALKMTNYPMPLEYSTNLMPWECRLYAKEPPSS